MWTQTAETCDTGVKVVGCLSRQLERKWDTIIRKVRQIDGLTGWEKQPAGGRLQTRVFSALVWSS